jgi:hypothetical protein
LARRRLVNVVALPLLLSLLATCGGDKAVDGTAVELPAAPAAPVATAAPTNTPLPGMSCRVPAVSAPATRCSEGGVGQFGDQINAAIHRLMEQEPDVVEGMAIRDLPRFRVGVLRNLEAAGLCAQWDADNEGHREIMVKSSNDFSEQYHISTSSGTVRYAPGAFRATCSPANFPVNPKPLDQRGDCALPSSRDYGCDRTGKPQFLDVMEAIVNATIQSRPDLIQDGYVVQGQQAAYRVEVVKQFRARGYCAIVDDRGEIAVKRSNDFSEQYLTEFSWRLLRRGDEAWTATCRPATF